MKPKKCKICSELFTPYNSLSMVCSKKCEIDYKTALALKNLDKIKKQEKKESKQRIAKMKADLLTKQDYMKILQGLVNKYVGLSDAYFCISCLSQIKGKRDSGHFFSVGNYPSVRFDLDNIHSQCIRCNQYNGGNLLEYRKYLIQKIGEDKFNDLDRKAHQNRQFTLGEIKEMIEEYKILIKK